MKILRTPDERFSDLADFPFEPHYAKIDAGDGTGTTLRVHYLDEGPPDADPVLLLHGEPSWGYLYRHVVPPLVAAGLFLGDGDYAAASASGILLATNVVCVNLAAVSVFLMQGIRPNRWAEKDRAKAAVLHALVIWGILLAGLILLIAYAAPENPLR